MKSKNCARVILLILLLLCSTLFILPSSFAVVNPTILDYVYFERSVYENASRMYFNYNFTSYSFSTQNFTQSPSDSDYMSSQAQLFNTSYTGDLCVFQYVLDFEVGSFQIGDTPDLMVMWGHVNGYANNRIGVYLAKPSGSPYYQAKIAIANNEGGGSSERLEWDIRYTMLMSCVNNRSEESWFINAAFYNSSGLIADVNRSRTEVNSDFEGNCTLVIHPLDNWKCYFYHCELFMGTGPISPIETVIPPAGQNGGLEGCGNWVFAEWKYYIFNATFLTAANASMTQAWIAFTDGFAWANMSYQPDVYNGTFTLADLSPEEVTDNIVRIKDGNATTAGNYTNVLFYVWFQEYVVDAVDVDIYMRVNGTDSGGAVIDSGWLLTNADVFHIYSKGGYAFNLTTWTAGNQPGPAYGGRLTDGTVFSLYAANGTYVEADYIFRNLQHVKLLPETFFAVGDDRPFFRITYFIDYCTVNYDWVEGWAIELQAINITYPHPISGSGAKHICFRVRGYERWSMKSENYIYMFHEGQAAAAGANATTRMWLDLWFNQENSSSRVGARVTSYMWPMTDNSAVWLRWLSTSWGPDDSKTIMVAYNFFLKDGDGNVITADKVKMVRVRCQLFAAYDAAQGGPQYAELRNYQEFDLTFSDLTQPHVGVPTPPPDEPLMPVMPTGGLIGALWSAMAWLGAWLADNIIYGGLSLWPNFVGIMDAIAGFFGWHGGFTWLIGFISDSFQWFISSLTWLVASLTPMFSFMALTMTRFGTFVSLTFGQWATMVQMVFGFFEGAYGTGFYIWNDLNLMAFLTLAILLLPLWLLDVAETQGADVAVNDVKMIVGLFAFVIKVLIKIFWLVITVITTIIESLPIVE